MTAILSSASYPQGLPKLYYDLVYIYIKLFHQQPFLSPAFTFCPFGSLSFTGPQGTALCCKALSKNCPCDKQKSPGARQQTGQGLGLLSGLGLTTVGPEGSDISVVICECPSISCGWSLASSKSLAQNTAALHKP